MTIKYITYTPTYNTENSDFDFFKNATDRESYIQQVINRDGKKMVQNIIKKSNSKIEYRGIYIHPKMPVLLMARVPKGGTIENYKNYISILNIDTSNFALKSELPKCKEYYLVKEEYKHKKAPNDYTKGIKEVLSNDDLSGSFYRDYLTTNLNDIPVPLAATSQANFTIDQYAIDGKTKIGHWEFNPTPEKVIENITKNTVKIIYTYLLEFKPDPNFDFTKDSDGDGIPDYKDTTPVGIEDPEATEEIKNDKNYVKPTQPYSSETSTVMQGLNPLATNNKAWTFRNIPNYSVFLYKDNKLISSAKADKDGNLVLHDDDGFSLKNNYDLYVQEKGKLTKKVDKVDVVISGNAHGKFIKDNQKVDYIQYKVFRNFNLSPFKDEIPIPTEIEPGYKFRKYDLDFNSEILSNVRIDLVISAKYDLLDDIKILFIVPNSTRFPEEKYVKPNGTLKLFTKDEFPIPNGNLIKWKRQSDGKEFNPGDSIPNITEDETFIAIWKDTRNATLTYDKGNGIGELEKKSKTVDKGESIYISSIRNVTPPKGYSWGGWNIEGKTYQPGMPYKITKDVTAYAIYIQNSYTITFDTKGGTPIDNKTIKYGESLTLPTKDEVSQVGFELKSWKRTSDKKLFNPGDIVENIIQDETFRAIWIDNSINDNEIDMRLENANIPIEVTQGQNLTIEKRLNAQIFNAENFSSGTCKIISDTPIKGIKLSFIPKYEATFERYGTYYFLKIDIAPEFTQDVPEKTYNLKAVIETKDGKKYTNVVGTITIDFKQNISFDLNKGTDPNNKYTPKTIIKGSKYKLPNCEIQPPKNSVFKCWEIDKTEYAPGNEITISKDTIIKAVWKRLPPKPEYPEPEIPGMKEKDHDTPTYPTQNP